MQLQLGQLPSNIIQLLLVSEAEFSWKKDYGPVNLNTLLFWYVRLVGGLLGPPSVNLGDLQTDGRSNWSWAQARNVSVSWKMKDVAKASSSQLWWHTEVAVYLFPLQILLKVNNASWASFIKAFFWNESWMGESGIWLSWSWKWSQVQSPFVFALPSHRNHFERL